MTLGITRRQEMKRIAECNAEIEELDRKRADARMRLEKIVTETKRDEHTKARSGQKLFIHNAQIGGRWPVLHRTSTSPVVLDLSDDSSLLLSCLTSVSDIVIPLLRYMGPMELFMVSRISKAFEKMVYESLPVISDKFLSYLRTEVVAGDAIEVSLNKTYQSDKTPLTDSFDHRVVKFKGIVMKQPVSKLGGMLSLLNHVFRVYRACDPSDNTKKYTRKAHAAYMFVYDPKRGRYVRPGELNLFKAQRLKSGLNALESRWSTGNENGFPLSSFQDPVELLNYTELGLASIWPVKYPLTLSDTTLIVDVDAGLVSRLGESGLLFYNIKVPYSEHNNKYFSENPAFIDYCDARIGLSGVRIRYRYKLTLDEHLLSYSK